MAISVREGSREDIVFTFTVSGVAFNLAGREIKLLRRDNKGVEDSFSTEDASPIIAITDAAAGELTLTPTATTWGNKLTSYTIYFEVQDGTIFVAWPEATNVTVTLVEDYRNS